MLEIDELRVRYGRVPALKGISLEVEQGRDRGVVGPNGAGKSTTLSTIFGLVRPDSGSISLEGKPLLRTPPERIVRLGLALVPEGRHIFNTLTVGENLEHGRDRAQGPGRQCAPTSAALLERFPVLERYYNVARRTALGRRAAAARDRTCAAVAAAAAAARRAVARTCSGRDRPRLRRARGAARARA